MLIYCVVTFVFLQVRTQAFLQGQSSTTPSSSGVEMNSKMIQDLIHRVGGVEDREREKDAHIATLEAALTDRHALELTVQALQQHSQSLQQQVQSLVSAGIVYNYVFRTPLRMCDICA
jgi:hypothetical protein